MNFLLSSKISPLQERDEGSCHLQRHKSKTWPGLHVLLYSLDKVKRFSSLFLCHNPTHKSITNTLPKAHRTRGLSSSNQSNILRSYHEFKHKSWSNFIFRISTKHQLQNFKQTSTSRLNLKFKILSRISTKIQLHNLYKTSATKYRPNSSFKFCLNFNFKILTKPYAETKNNFMSKLQLPSLHQTF